MIINTEGKMPNMPNMVKRGFNQTPNDIRDKLLQNQLAYEKQKQIQKNKENNLNNSLDSKDKINALNKLNKYKGEW